MPRRRRRCSASTPGFATSRKPGSATACTSSAAPAASARGAAFEACGPAEIAGLLKALDGRFVPPGPAGSPAGARRDVLPTGRNLYAVDPRAVPTRTAYEIGTRAAAEVLARYAQDHGEWPRRLVLDLWGSATMRTGGDDLGQAFALMGVRPRWDHGSTRVNGFEILPLARLDHPRVDVTLRISGLFRDLFPDQIALFDAAVRAVAGLDEEDDVNPLAAAAAPPVPAEAAAQGALHRVFGAAPERYGLGLARRIAAGDWSERRELGETYLAGSSHAYGGVSATAQDAPGAFRDRVREADAYVHVADLPGIDLLSSDVAAEHQGGFAAAAERARREASALSRRRHRAGNPEGPQLDRRGGARREGAGHESALDRRADAAWLSRCRRDRRDGRRALRFRGHHGCGSEPPLRSPVRRDARRRGGARFPDGQQSVGGPIHRGSLRRGRHPRVLGLAPELDRRPPGRDEGDGVTAAPETRVGWCPGALRPMPSRDGLIVRVKPRGATLSPAQAIGIAAAASTFGNGALDLTSHANLQIRGASDASLPA